MARRRRGVRDHPAQLPALRPDGGRAGATARRSAPVERSNGQQREPSPSVRGAFRAAMGAFLDPLWLERADQQLYRAKAGGPHRASLEMPPVRMSAPRRRACSSPCQFQEESRMNTRTPRTASLAVTSGKGGVGKTFVSGQPRGALARRRRARCWCSTPTWAWLTWTWCSTCSRRSRCTTFHRQVQLDQAIPRPRPAASVMLPAPGYGGVPAHDARCARRAARRDPEAMAPRFDRILIDTGAGISDVVLR